MSSVLHVDSAPPYVLTSWKRCQNNGLIPDQPTNDQIISGRKLQEIKQNHTLLLQHAIPLIQRLLPVLKRNQQIILLVNPDGDIIHHEGDPTFASQAQAIQLQTGANWHENRKGTNAIGLALIEKEAMIVEGSQHFFTENHGISCASSPIFSSSGELVGVINISGPPTQDYLSALTLVCLTAERIQTQLLLAEAKLEHSLMLQEWEYTANLLSTPVITMDREQRILRANQSAKKMIGQDCIGKRLEKPHSFFLKTIEDHTSKLWRSIAIHQPVKKKENKSYQFEDIFATCPSILKVKGIAKKAALTDFPLLLLGESGTGKELFAQAIHQQSLRQGQPFIAVNCSAIPDSLVESEFFGYVRGAFTGANTEGSIGKVEAAHEGTLFLDEIGDMSLRAQATLLRVIQEQTITPVGSVHAKPIDVRIIAATHRDLLAEVKAGRFRADLYYRLKGIQILLPPLRKRTDIIELAEHLLERLNISTTSFTLEARAFCTPILGLEMFVSYTAC
ncbi:sigma-54-dependent Fis family transcriptional regulator [Caldalkalibacillus mannanilyticus]|uniref:sigma-54-dependent Fis family transcriptional regulator n=1 Tax=Caldalkalibacillus mannanilyticus TaxID=1418 RepID=UPI00046863A5|nr:sigma-54-dependent Fis family transcriptional regulator [Caldalkalibacillus mannanilyticus]